ncbi:hypothetical protein ACHAXS_000385 [Conticribra weissflogii]
MYMEILQGITTKQGDSKDYILQLISNLYGKKQAGKLLKRGYTQSFIDECVFYKGSVIFILNVGDGIFLGLTDLELSQSVKTLQQVGMDIEDQVNPSNYVGYVSSFSRMGPINSPRKLSLRPS